MSKALLVIVAIFGLASVALAGCSANQFGSNCDCSSDVNGLISARGLSNFTASCNAGTWTISGTGLFDIGNSSWAINTDTIDLSSAAFSSNAAVISLILNMNNPLASGFLRIANATLNGLIKFTLGDWNRANRTANVPFNFSMSYMRIGAPNGQFQPTAPTLLAADQPFWEIPAGSQVSFATTVSGGLTTYTTTVPLSLKSVTPTPSPSPASGGGSRDRGCSLPCSSSGVKVSEVAPGLCCQC